MKSIIAGRGALLALPVLALSLGMASASTVVSNLPEAYLGATGSGKGSGFFYLGGGSFTTGGTAVSMQSIDASLYGVTGTYQMNLYADNGAIPGALLTVLGTTNYLGGVTSFTPGGGNYGLAAATTYYWAIEMLTDGDVNIEITASFAEAGDPGWSIGNGFVFDSTGGGSWITGSSVPKFAVSATAVPEPSSALLGALALGGLAIRRRR